MLFILGLTFSQAFGQSITLGTVPSNLCANESFDIPITLSGFSIGNSMVAQLSTSDGSFPVTPTVIGTASVYSDGTHYIQAQIPSSLTFSTSYRIRVSSAVLPAVLSGISGNININCTTNDYYWVGGSGNWSDINHWANSSGGVGNAYASAPTTNDNVHFDSFSFPSGGQITLDQEAYCNDMVWTDGSSNPIIYAEYSNRLYVKGDLIFANGVYNDVYRIYFQSEKQNIQVNFANNLIQGNPNTYWYPRMYFYYPGDWSLQSDITNFDYVDVYGSLKTNDHFIDIRFSLYLSGTFDGGNSTINTSSFYGYGTFATNSFNLNLNRNQYGDGPYWYGSNTYNNVTIGSGTCYVQSDNTIGNLTLVNGGGIRLAPGTTQTITSNLVAQGAGRDNLAVIKSDSPGNQANIIVAGATVTADYASIADNYIDDGGGTTYNATNSVDYGNNNGWLFPSPLTSLNYYWIGGDGNWTDLSHWATTDGGSTTQTELPGSIDNIFFTTNSFPSGGTVTVDEAITINNMTWQSGSGAQNPGIFSDWGQRVTIKGNLAMDDGVSRQIGNMTFDSSNGLNQIDFADNTNSWGNIEFLGGGSWTLFSDLVTGNDLSFYEGTFNTNDFSVTFGGGYINRDETTLNLGSSDINVNYSFYNYASAPTINTGSSTFYLDNQFNTVVLSSYYGGPMSLNNVVVSNDSRIEGSNTFNSLTVSPGATLELFAGETQTIVNSLNLQGSRSQLVSLKSYDYGTPGQGILAVLPSTAVTADFVSIQDNLIDNTFPGIDVSATNAEDKGGNTGWTFSAIVPFDYRWINGEGTWSDVSHWESSSDGVTFISATDAPGPVDNIFFTSNSFPSGGTLTIDQETHCNNMTWESGSGDNSPTIFADYEYPLVIQGSLQMADGVTRDMGRLFFESDKIGNTIHLADNLFTGGDIDFRGSGEWTLLSSLNTTYLNIRGGTLNTNNKTINVEQQIYLDYNFSGTINWGSSTVNLRVLFQDSNAITFNAQSSTFKFNPNGSTSYLYMYNPLVLNSVIFDGNAYIYSGPFECNNLSIGPGSNIYFGSGYTHTINNNFIAVGTRDQLVNIKSTNPGNSTTLFVNTFSGTSLDVEYAIIQDITLDNGSAFTTTEIASQSIDKGGNTGWDFLTEPLLPADFYWVGGSGFWSDYGSHWAMSSGGTDFYSYAPLLVDNVYFDGNSFPSGGTLTLDYPIIIHDMDWNGSTTSVSISDDGNEDNTLTLSGSLALADGVSRDFTQLIFDSEESGLSIFMADNLQSRNYVYFYGSGDWLLDGDYEAYYTRFYNGTFNSNDYDFTSTYLRLYDDNISYWGSSDVYVSRFYNYLTDPLDFNAETSTFYFTEPTSNYINGNASVFNNVEFEGDTYIYGNNQFSDATANDGLIELDGDQIFIDLTMEEGTSLSLRDGSIQSITNSLNLNGSSNSPVVVNSFIDGAAGAFTAPFGVAVNADFVHLKDNTATGGAIFNATNSSDFGNVTGWSGLKVGQTIDFEALSDQLLTDGDFSVSATASSSLDVTFEIAFGSATSGGSNGQDIIPSASGLLAIKATQNGNSTYGSAYPVTRYVHIDATDTPNELGNMKEARTVLGQADAFSNDYEYTDVSIPYPWQVAVSTSGKMAVANGSRVLIWNQIPSSPSTPADVVIGHNDFDTEYSGSPSSSVFADEVYSVAFSHDDKLLVADSYRVLIWNTIPSANGTPADFVIGQPDFTSTWTGAEPNRFEEGPKSIVTYYNNGDASEKLLISDIYNSRVLVYNAIPDFNDAWADFVIGQPDLYAYSTGSAAHQMFYPVHLAVSPEGKLLVADYGNSRVLVFNSIPNFNQASADMVLGQPDFGYSDEGVGPTSFRFSTGVSVSRTGKLAISDYGNNRVLIYNSIPTDNTIAPDYILGQPDASSNDENYNSISGRSMSYPINVDWDLSENLYISDNENNRVLLYGAVDLESPTIESFTLLQPQYTIGATDQKTTIVLSDRSGISEVTGFYNDINYFDPENPSYEQVALTDVGNNTYEFDLSGVESLSSSPTGVEYYIEARDNVGNFVSTIDNKQVLPIYYPDGITINGYGVGDATENYRIMAVPAELDNEAVEHVFQSIFGGSYDNTKMRVFSYSGGSATSYNEASGSTSLKVGAGYFALAASGSGSSVTSPDGALTSFITTDDGSGQNTHEFVINLVNGWNLIGNPFMHSIVWNDVKNLSGITAGQVDNLQNYTGNYNNITTIPAGGGAFVRNNTGSNFTLRIPALINSGGRIAGISENDNPLTESSWEVWLRAFDADNDEIVLGGIGMEEDAVLSKDQYDWLNPPAFSRMKLIEFNHPEFSEPSFKKDIRQASNEEKWSFIYKVDNPTNSLHELHWDNAHIGESSPDLYLVDKTHFAMINMKEENSYSFNHGGLTEFEIYFGANALEAIMPEEFMTQSPYPNPFTHDVTFNIGLPLDEKYSIEVMVFDSMGKIVRKLSKDNVVSGYNSIVWDGLNTDGRLLPSGIYAYSIYVNGVNVNAVKSGKLIKR